MGDEPLFDLDSVFDADYLYFYDSVLPAERTARDLETICRLLELEPGQAVLDLGCGHGRIANGLAQRGLAVTGLDRSAAFLAKARSDATSLGVDVEYVQGDMRAPGRANTFDAVIIWFTTFGYFSDDDNESVLTQSLNALKSGGRLLIEQMNRYGMLGGGRGLWHATRRGDDFLVDLNRYNGLTDRQETRRILHRNGVVRTTTYAIRLYGFAELARLLKGLGARAVDGFGADGEPFTTHGQRLIVRAQK